MAKNVGDELNMVEKVHDINEWATANKKMLSWGGIAVLAVIVGGYSWRQYKTSLNSRAETEAGTLVRSLASSDEPTQVRKLTEFAAKYSGTEVADEALIQAAQLALQSGKPAEAATVLEKVGGGLSTPMGVGAALMRAGALADAGKKAEALSAYEAIGNGAHLDADRYRAWIAAAYLSWNETAKATGYMQNALKLTKESSTEQLEIQMRLAELGSPVAPSGS